MKFKRNLKILSGTDSILIVPLIDTIFLLLVFFILNSSLTHSGLNVQFPKAITSSIFNEENLNITLTSENIIYLNNNVVTLKELTYELSNPRQKNVNLLIKADRRASVGRIVDVWELCRRVGIEKINIVTNQER